MKSKKEIEEAYWKGYIQKQNEAVEICKQCKYRKKARELGTREQELKRVQEENGLQRWQLNSAFDNGFIHKDKIRKKISIDKSKLNNCTNNIFKNICKARIEFGEELLEEK